jgi:hypothetical protein
MPVMGFYLQPAAGGIVLSYSFWRRFAEIENVVGIKIAPFNRYYTLDVVRAVVQSGRAGDIALYTGNDDTILFDLLTPMRFGHSADSQTSVAASIVGGLLGHWAVWTRTAVALLDQIRAIKAKGASIPLILLETASQITDANAAFFDARNAYRGSIAGIHEVLRGQGLLAGWRRLSGFTTPTRT